MTEPDFRLWLESALVRELAQTPLPAIDPALARYRAGAAAERSPVARRRTLTVAAALVFALTSVVVASAAPALPAAQTLASDANRLVQTLVGSPPLVQPAAPSAAPETGGELAAPATQASVTASRAAARSDAEERRDAPLAGPSAADAAEPESESQEDGRSAIGRQVRQNGAEVRSQERAEEKTSDFSSERSYSGNSVTKPSGNGNQTQEESTRNDP